MQIPNEPTTHGRIDPLQRGVADSGCWDSLPPGSHNSWASARGPTVHRRGAKNNRNNHYESETAAPPDAGEYRTGTTTVAVAASDGAVLAADRRMSLGGRFTASKDVRKIEQVHPTGAVAIAGAVGPAQGLLDSLRAEATLYESRRGREMSMTALSKTAGHLVRGLPVRPLLAGVDDAGAHAYELDGGGSVIEDGYAASGSGMQLAYGVLEGRIEAGIGVDDARAAAAAAVEAASERDGASGNGVTLATITDDGVAFERRGS